MNIIFGSGGVASEILWLLHRQSCSSEVMIVAETSETVAECRAKGLNAIREDEYITCPQIADALTYIAVGLPRIREKITTKLTQLDANFPALIDRDASLDRRPGKVSIGRGSIIYPTASLTTEIVLGEFVHVNPQVSIAHHCHIGDFTTICPGAVIPGNIVIGRRCFIGAGAKLRDGICLADGVTVGAGATVVSNLIEPGTYVGSPAKRISIR
jgi:sugar O-acyltransferase (sialic acid O-acetyltransferase NeuD family)